MEERVDAYRVLVGKPEEKRLIRRPGGNWEDNIRKYLKETISEDLTASGYGHVAGCCECDIRIRKCLCYFDVFQKPSRTLSKWRRQKLEHLR